MSRSITRQGREEGDAIGMSASASLKKAPYRPLGDEDENGGPEEVTSTLFSFSHLAVATVSLPLFGFFFCILWSLWYNFVSSTATHCNVTNYLPSMSAAIGTFTPQKYVWRLTIGLHSAPRYLISYIYRLKHKSNLILFLNWVEVSALLGLSVVSSTEYFAFHAFCFATFLVSALVHMVLVSYGTSLRAHRLSSERKRLLTLAYFAGTAFAIYFFWRHNRYCEAGVYTMFAMSEYIVVLTNICFHFQAFYDLRTITFTLTRSPERSLANYA